VETSATTADYQKIVSDYVVSSERQKRYQPFLKYAATLDAETSRRNQQKERLEATQAILVQYMLALGSLAADELPKFDASIDVLNEALVNAKFVGDADSGINNETATAAATIAKMLTNITFGRWRQAKISRIVKDTDNNVQNDSCWS